MIARAGFTIILMCLPWIGGCKEQPSDRAEPSTAQRNLVILTPHNKGIQRAFELGFRDWHQREHGSEVSIRWVVNGTPKCVKYVEGCFLSPTELAPSLRPDLLFGGSMADHRSLQERGWTSPIALDGLESDLPATISDEPTRCADGSCVATGLSTFGILYNQEACIERDIAAPSQWEDLASDRFFGWLAVADPSSSGTSLQCLMLILQKHGWEKGWGIVLRILANSRTLVRRSGIAMDQVESGESLATFAINFDAMARAERSSYGLGYVEPRGETRISPDGVSVLASAPNHDIAERFVRFLLSQHGQAIWGLRSEYLRLNAPTLYHYPISQSIYEKRSDQLSVPGNPLLSASMLKIDEALSRKQLLAIPVLVQAVCSDNHITLQRAWERVIKAGKPESSMAQLLKPPLFSAELDDLAKRLENSAAVQREQMIANLAKKLRKQLDAAATTGS
ncbi:MAG: ABC transporter substrate-binding protein [Planctomycetota bacterium]|jgi:ABC-type Fe3+ transport system substrate-binding protein